MRKILVFALLIILTSAGAAQAGRTKSCNDMPYAPFNLNNSTLSAPKVHVSGFTNPFKLDFSSFGYFFKLTGVMETTGTAPYSGEVFFTPTATYLDLHCILYDDFYLWSQFSLTSTTPEVVFNLDTLGIAPDVANTEWSINWSSKCDGKVDSTSQLAINKNYQAFFDGENGPVNFFENFMSVQTGSGTMQGTFDSGRWNGTYIQKMTTPCFSGELQNTSVLLNQDRFQVQAVWSDGVNFGDGRPVENGPDSAAFFFFSPDNWEMLLKVLDGCAENNHFWVFFAATTDVEFTVTVTDTQEDVVKQYTNALGHPADAVVDTTAFATCP